MYIATVKCCVGNDLNGTWEENQIVQGSFPSGENYSVRDLQIYMDQQTGLEYIFWYKVLVNSTEDLSSEIRIDVEKSDYRLTWHLFNISSDQLFPTEI